MRVAFLAFFLCAFVVFLLLTSFYGFILHSRVRTRMMKGVEEESHFLLSFVCEVVKSIEKQFLKKYGKPPNRKELIEGIKKMMSNYNYLGEESTREFIHQVRMLVNRHQLEAEREVYGKRVDLFDEIEKEKLIEKVATEIATSLLDECVKKERKKAEKTASPVKVVFRF